MPDQGKTNITFQKNTHISQKLIRLLFEAGNSMSNTITIEYLGFKETFDEVFS